MQRGTAGVSATGAQGTHLLDFSFFDHPDLGPLLEDSWSYVLRFAISSDDASYATAAIWLDNVSVVEYVPIVSVPGDYNDDGSVDAADADEQAVAMMTPNQGLEIFDENADGVIDQADRAIWVHDHAGTWYGDADLNGDFNSSDMVQVFVFGKYETEEDAGWAEGDWDGSGIFDSSDMVTAFADGGYEQGLRTDAVVPEPMSAILLLGSLIVIATHRRRVDR